MGYALGILLIIYCLIFVYKTKTGSPSVMSQTKAMKRVGKYVKPGMKVADLGAGDGSALIEMVKAGATTGEGWEIEPWVWLQAQRKIYAARLQGQIKVNFGDMWRADLGKYELLYVYQLTRYAPRLVKKIRQEMNRGSVVVANTYPLKGLPLAKKDGELYIYRI